MRGFSRGLGETADIRTGRYDDMLRNLNRDSRGAPALNPQILASVEAAHGKRGLRETVFALKTALDDRIPRIVHHLTVDRRKQAVDEAEVLRPIAEQAGAIRMVRFLEILCQTGNFCERSRVEALARWLDGEWADLNSEIDTVLRKLAKSPGE